MIISLDQHRINNGKDIPIAEEYKKVFKDWRIYNVIKREYVSFNLESTQTISQLKYGSYSNGNKEIFDALRTNATFLRIRKYDSQIEASIGYFLGINPELTLGKALKENIDDIIT